MASALSYLRSFPFNRIKIDRSFVTDIAVRPEALAIVRTILMLADSLGMTMTAEGVETDDQKAGELSKAACRAAYMTSNVTRIRSGNTPPMTMRAHRP